MAEAMLAAIPFVPNARLLHNGVSPMLDVIVIVIYFVAQLAIGLIARSRVSNEEDFVLAGRRLGPMLYGGTMAAVVLGGASTIGGVGLGYQYGLSGMWLVFSIGCGLILLSWLFAERIRSLRVYTVGEMLELRYGPGARPITGLVMGAYTLLICVVSTIACGALLSATLGMNKLAAMVLGGGVVLAYSLLGGMWSITLTDIVQFVLKTIGIFFILLPASLFAAGGIDGLTTKLPESAFSLTHVGGDAILAYFVTYVFGMVIGQDIWQRISTARTANIAKWSGIATGFYCLAYAAAGAVIGMSAKVVLPSIDDRNLVFSAMVSEVMPAGLSGLVIAAALAAIMSTASGSLIAAATVTKMDVVAPFRGSRGASQEAGDEIAGARLYLLVLGVSAIAIAAFVQDIVAALTIAYGVLVGGLAAAIIGGIVWKRANIQGALASILVGVGATVVAMIAGGDIYASTPILAGISASAITLVAASYLFAPTSPQRLGAWRARLRGEGDAVADRL
jgi:SSS family solute:Na+ symporter